MRLTDEQRNILESLFPKPRGRDLKGGRPGTRREKSSTECYGWSEWELDGTTSRGYPSGTTCYRHFRKWVELGVFDKIARSLVEDLRKRGKIDLTAYYDDFGEGLRSNSERLRSLPWG